ncbi:MAG TPA: YqgE/AlgH family protein [Methylocystis sp.]|nr:YqgE/AlgH family protein [Methylocystis sp.]
MKPTRDKQPASKLAGRDQARQAEGERDGGAEHEAFAAPARKKGLGGKARSAESPLQANSGSFLDGQLLIAMPGMSDERFARSVIYMCAHSAEGAMGIMLNRPSSVRNFPELLEQLRVIDSAERISLPPAARDVQVLSGGPVQTDRGFVLHTGDFFIDNSTLKINDAVSLTATIDILRAIAIGQGPDRALLALGCAGWDAGQLENEIQLNGWLHCPADPAILFDHDLDTKYIRALRSIGVDLGKLSSNAGHA